LCGSVAKPRAGVRARIKLISNTVGRIWGGWLCIHVCTTNSKFLKNVVSTGPGALVNVGHIVQGVADEEGAGRRILETSKHFTSMFL